MKIGYRTVKTAIGTGLSVWIARQLDLEFYTMAGIITMLGIQPTLKRSVAVSAARFVLGLIAVLISTLLFEWFGYHVLTLTLFLLLFIPLTVRLGLLEGLVMSSVLVMHVLTYEELTWSLFINEMVLILVGVSVALVFNLFMPDMGRRLEELRKQLNEEMRLVLLEIATGIRTGGKTGMKRVPHVEEQLRKVEEVTSFQVENQVWKRTKDDDPYLDVRKQQLYGLRRMKNILDSVRGKDPLGEQMAEWVENVAKNPAGSGHSVDRLEELALMYEGVHQEDLPRTWEEFETRSALYHLLRELSHHVRWEMKLEEKRT